MQAVLGAASSQDFWQSPKRNKEQEHGDEKVGEEQDGKREVLISKDWTCVVQLPPPTG